MNQDYITEETLQAFGVNIGDQDMDSLLDHLNETLQERIGTEIAGMLDETRLNQLLDLEEAGADEKQIGAWLQQNVPELKEIVQDEIDILMGELNENADAINKAV